MGCLMASGRKTNESSKNLHISLPIEVKKGLIAVCKSRKITVSKQLASVVETWLAFVVNPSASEYESPKNSGNKKGT